MAAVPTGTQADQMPIAVPRFSAANHCAMSVGASTAMKPVPTPSITRLRRSVVLSLLSAYGRTEDPSSRPR